MNSNYAHEKIKTGTARHLRVLGHELVVELYNPLNPVSTRCKECGPEVQRVLLLTEPRSRDNADSGGFEQAHAVELIGSAAFFSGSLDGLGRKRDRGEEVHGTLSIC